MKTVLATASIAALLWAAAPAAIAETLADAIARAYRTNPDLQQRRAQLRGIDENYVEAASALRPTVTGQVTGDYLEQRLGRSALAQARQFNPAPSTITRTNTGVAQVVVQQTLFTGGRVSAQIRSADAQIGAGRQSLRSLEGDLLLQVVDSYTSVLRDSRIRDVRAKSVDTLTRALDEAQARKAAGEGTLTDVAQATAQLEAERANLATANQQLQASRAAFAAAVGADPGDLAPEPVLPNLPVSVADAFRLAETENPDLREARLTEESSRALVAAARAQNRPNVALQGSYGYSGTLQPFAGRDYERDLSGEVVVTVPLYTGGLNSSNIRRAIEQNNADRLAAESMDRRVVQSVSNAWNAMLIGRSNVASQERQVAAASTALEGMTEEYRGGLRSTFEVLYAEQTLRDAEILLLVARHDAYLGAAQVLRVIGALEVPTVAQGIVVYDPSVNTRRIERAGALPWDSLVRAIDRVAEPSPGVHLVANRPVDPAPTIAVAAVEPATSAPITTASPPPKAIPTTPSELRGFVR